MKIEKCRVVVTGGAGFIGSHLVDRLLAAGNEVVVIDDLSSGEEKNLERHAGDPRLRLEVKDILDEAGIAPLFRGSRCVFHLATRNVRLSLKQPTAVHEVNTTGTLNVLKAAAAARAGRFLYCSSSEVYGTADVVPMAEEYDFHPETMYGASKLAGEYYAQVFHRAGWLPGVIARPHNTYGPREHYAGVKGEVIPRFILRALAGLPLTIYGDGRQTRDFTYVEETAEFLVLLAESDRCLGRVFNVCRGEEISVGEIAAIVSDLVGGRGGERRVLPGRPSDVLRLYGDPSRLRQALGRAPEVPIREGLARTLDWFRKNVPLNRNVIASLGERSWEEIEGENWMPAKRGEAQT